MMIELSWPWLLGLVALGGGLGALARLALVTMAARRWGAAWPWGTWAANLGGALLVGVLLAILNAGDAGTGRWLWWLLIAGLLGSLTTVSSFSLQTLLLARHRGPGAALTNVLVSVCGCLAAATLSWWLTTAWLASAGGGL